MNIILMMISSDIILKETSMKHVLDANNEVKWHLHQSKARI